MRCLTSPIAAWTSKNKLLDVPWSEAYPVPCFFVLAISLVLFSFSYSQRRR